MLICEQKCVYQHAHRTCWHTHSPAILLFSVCLSKKCQNDTFVFIFPKLHECFMLMSTVRSLGHVGTVSYITTLFLRKPPYWGFGINELESNLGKKILAKWCPFEVLLQFSKRLEDVMRTCWTSSICNVFGVTYTSSRRVR